MVFIGLGFLVLNAISGHKPVRSFSLIMDSQFRIKISVQLLCVQTYSLFVNHYIYSAVTDEIGSMFVKVQNLYLWEEICNFLY